MSKPEYHYIDADQMAIHKDDEKQVKVIAGKFKNAEGPIKGHNVEPVYFDIELKKGKEFSFEIPSTHNSFIYLIDGEIKIGDKNIIKLKTDFNYFNKRRKFKSFSFIKCKISINLRKTNW